jgi:hypothetical protein
MSWQYPSQLDRIETKLDALTTLVRWFITHEGKIDMATQATLDRLNADVTANTNAVAAALEANNATLTASVPVTAAAIVAGTAAKA